MNRSDLVQKVAERVNLPRKKAEEVVDLIFDSMTQALAREDRVEIRGLGSFTVKHYQTYRGRNPRTGAIIQVKPKKLPFFKVGKELKKRVDSGPDESPPSTPSPFKF